MNSEVTKKKKYDKIHNYFFMSANKNNDSHQLALKY
jgi:hypothetical protein